MRFLVDDCTGPAVARWLEERGHDVFSVYDDALGIADTEIIRRAHEEERILITNDKDFGGKVYREPVFHVMSPCLDFLMHWCCHVALPKRRRLFRLIQGFETEDDENKDNDDRD